LIHQANLQYVGAFRVPSYYDSTDGFSYGGTGLAFNSANNSLFIAGQYQTLTEISIPPSIINSNNLDSLARATMLQPWAPVLSRLPTPLIGATDGASLGGLIVYNGQLIGTQWAYYSGAAAQTTSHFIVNSLNLASAAVFGLYQVGDNNPGARFLAGYMTAIPSEWQAALGAPYLTGLSNVPIISSTSSGPAAFGFDPASLGSGSGAALPYVYYPVDKPLGTYSGPANPMQGGNAEIGGILFPPGTGSVLYFGSSGTNYKGYGLAQDYGDPYDGGKGPHSLNGEYASQVWAYSANDFVAVKQGAKQPWQVMPYDVWNFSFPINTGQPNLGGVAFDPATRRVYVSLLNADHEEYCSSLPLIEVFQVNVPSGTQAPAAPEIGTLAVTPSTLVPGAISAGTAITLTAGNVYAITPGAGMAQVAFYLDTNNNGTLDVGTDRLLGQGSGAANMPDGSSTNWTLASATTGMASGSHTVFALATDSNGLTSRPITTTFQIQ